ncbi:MAG: CoA pyrophosphatase [Rhizomicrobium sp.]
MPARSPFPAAAPSPSDISLVETALRETQEETGIEPAFVTVAGFLDPYETGTGYAILPVVGVLSDGFALVAQEREVAKIFEVPLGFLLDPANKVRQTREFQGVPRSFYSFTYEGHYIWGATAAMLINFAERISGAMRRILFEHLPFFLMPFVLYGFYLMLQRMRADAPSRAHPWTLLFIAGLSLFALSFVLWGVTEGDPITRHLCRAPYGERPRRSGLC